MRRRDQVRRADQIYSQKYLEESCMKEDPMEEFSTQLELATAVYGDEATIMSLSTVCARLRPHSRMVLLKKQEGRQFFFYSQYRSQKAREIEFSPFGALLFFWPCLGKQIRVEGPIAKTTRSDSMAYFCSRPRDSQIGAWASTQSEAIASRDVLEARVAEFETRFAAGSVPYPPHWGGYRLTATHVEFWQGRPARLHDRIAYTYRKNGWTQARLCP